MLWLLTLVSLLFSSSSFLMEGMKPPLYRQQGSLFSAGGSIPCQRGRQMLLFLLTQGVLTHFTPPFVLFGLAYHDPVP